MRSSISALLCGCALSISACSPSLREPTPSVSAPPNPSRVPAPTVLREEGLEGVIGNRAASLTRRFGAARIDLKEGDARKLQFASEACVLDIYLYPLSRDTTPVATHIEARRRVGGAATDRAGCIADVERSASGE